MHVNKIPQYAFPLSIQLNMPHDLRSAEFRTLLALLQTHGFSGVELNILDYEAYAPDAYTGLLREHGLKLTMIATGGYAKRHGLSLSSNDVALRARSIEETKKIIAFAEKAASGVILGFIKGPPCENRDMAVSNFVDSLKDLDAWTARHAVPLLIEATNRYEAAVANTLTDAAGLIAGFGNPWLRVLPDTFHMNIEEADSCFSLLANRQHYQSIHISDNNRCFPAYGGIDFFKILACLKGMGYRGGMAIEGNAYGSLEEHIVGSALYLRTISDRLLMLG